MTRTRFSRFAFLLVAAILLTVSVASAAGPYQFYSVTPCRIADTRGNGFTGPSGPPALSAGSPRNFPIIGAGLPSQPCGVPSDAKAAALNVTAVGPTLEGFLEIWPYNTPRPLLQSTINFAAGEPAIANGAIVPLSSDATFQISLVYGTATVPGSVNLILDVTGYFK
jgi:hypothetical protein